MKPDYYVFNGDTDGICAAHQIILSQGSALCVTGVKRDISLLKKIKEIENKKIAVFDIAIEKNLPELEELLAKGCEVIWFDHHISKVVTNHPNFSPNLDTRLDVNTSWLVNQYMKGQYVEWAIVGLFGDVMDDRAKELAAEYNIDPEDLPLYKELGVLMNYNAYGGDISDLLISPESLLQSMLPYEKPLEFIQNTETLKILRKGFVEDSKQAQNAKYLFDNVVIFPDEKWGRRIIGSFANQLLEQFSTSGVAILVEKPEGGYVVSVRAPQKEGYSAEAVCSQFPTGGGRIKAAGINHLPQEELDHFLEVFQKDFV